MKRRGAIPYPITMFVLMTALVAATGCDEVRSGRESVAFRFGRTGVGPGEFSYPRAAVVDALGRVYIVDKSARIQCFAPDGTFLHEWKMPASEAGKPTGLGIGPDGRIYVADTHYSRVVIYEPDGTLVTMFGERGTGPGQFMLPTDVAIDPEGFIYVSEYGGNDRISKFTPAHEYVKSFGGAEAGPDQLQRPQAMLFDRQQRLWVTDACNHVLRVYSRDGALLHTYGKAGTAIGELRFPYGFDWLSDGTLVVAEYGNNRIQRFDQEGHCLGAWGTAGRLIGQLAYPWAAVVGADDRIYVVDSGNNRVQVLADGGRGVWQHP